MEKDLEIIKRRYGEKFAHMCRTFFPTLLENENILPELLKKLFGTDNKFLYKDIVDNKYEYDFKNLIYSYFDVECDKNQDVKKTTEELFDEAGYILFPEYKTNEELQSFKKYYAPNEGLCTFYVDRLYNCRVWFAIKKDIDKIDRNKFIIPKRQDEYGTSVLSIQWTKDNNSTLSIKNRYNHRVNNPDATFSNNLDNIYEGLHDSFVKEFNINTKKEYRFDFPEYVLANNGRYYKSLSQVNDTHFCINNIIVDNGRVKHYDKDKYLVTPNYIFDLKNKKVEAYLIREKKDAFIDSLGEIKNISVVFDARKDKHLIIKPISGSDIDIKLDNKNQMTKLINNNVKVIEEDFLFYNNSITDIELNNALHIKDRFLFHNNVLSNIKCPNVLTVKDRFLFNNANLENIDLSSAVSIGNYFMFYNQQLKDIKLSDKVSYGEFFLYSNNMVKDIPQRNKSNANNRIYYLTRNIVRTNNERTTNNNETKNNEESLDREM